MRMRKGWPWVVGSAALLAAGAALLAGRNGRTGRRYVGPSPIGLGYVKPNHYLEMAKVLRMVGRAAMSSSRHSVKVATNARRDVDIAALPGLRRESGRP